MSGAFPTAWQQRLPHWLRRMASLQLLAALVILLLLTSIAGGLAPWIWLPWLGPPWAALAIALPVVLLTSSTLPALHAEGRVLRERRAPERAWRQRVAQHSLLLLATLLIGVCGLVVVGLAVKTWLLPTQLTLVDMLLPPARLCAVWALVLMATASLRGLLPRWVAGAMALALWVVIFEGPRLNSIFGTSIARTPAPATAWTLWHGGLSVLLAPLALALVHARLLRIASPTPWDPGTTATRAALLDAGTATLRRLCGRWLRVDNPNVLLVLAWLLFQAVEQALRPQPSHLGLLQPMGSSVGLGHALRLLAFTALAVCTLRTDALHWRSLLAPAGPKRSTLGVRVVLETWGFLLATAVLAMALALLVRATLPVFDPPAWHRLPAVAASHALPFASDLLLGAALGVWLRAWAGNHQRAVRVMQGVLAGCICLWLLAMPLALYRPTPSPDALVLWHRDAGHLLGQLLVALAFIAAAQRRWSRLDLTPFVQPARLAAG